MTNEDIEYMKEQVIEGFTKNKEYILKLIDEGHFERLKDEMEDIRSSTNGIFDEMDGVLEELVEDEDEDWDDEDEDDELDEEDKTEDE